jgi:carboxyl-terminal processing protease
LINSTQRRSCAFAFLLLGLLLFLPTRLTAESVSENPLDTARKAERRDRNWLLACQKYDEVLSKDRTNAEAREGYARCLRRLHQVRRHADPAYYKAVVNLKLDEALKLYEQILTALGQTYVDPNKTDPGLLFRQGLIEFQNALEEVYFCKEYLGDPKQGKCDEFAAKLAAWPELTVKSPREARNQLFALIGEAQDAGILPEVSGMSILIMEFACGACNCLDEYSLFLTPGHFDQAARDKLVGIGVELRIVEKRAEVARIYPKSPAKGALFRNDEILAIDGQPLAIDGRPIDGGAVAGRLRGVSGSMVELQVRSPDGKERVVKIARQAVTLPSVEHEILADAGDVPIGWLRINYFQKETTAQEVREALARLQTDGIKALVLDLRGNPGGQFSAAIEVAGIFLGESVVVLTQGQHKDYNNKEWKSNVSNPFALPMAVLIDGDTASAAELLAGALKEQSHKRPILLIGQTTFGKGTIQSIVHIDAKEVKDAKILGRLRLTVAKFYTPGNKPYSGRGISPDLERDTTNETDLLLYTRQQLRILLGITMPPMGMMPMTPATPAPSSEEDTKPHAILQ